MIIHIGDSGSPLRIGIRPLLFVSFVHLLALLFSSAALATPVRDLARAHADDWILITAVEPNKHAVDLIFSSNLNHDQEEILVRLAKGGIRFDNVRSDSLFNAAQTMRDDEYGKALLIRGRELNSSSLTHVLVDPFRIFVIAETNGIYAGALVDDDEYITFGHGSSGMPPGGGELYDEFLFDINELEEPLLITFGDSYSLSQKLDDLYLNGTIARAEAAELLESSGFTYQDVKTFAPASSIVSSGFNGIITTSTALRETVFREWLSQHGRRATVRRFSEVITTIEVTKSLRELSADQVNAVALDLTPVEAPNAQMAPVMGETSQSASPEIAFDAMQSDQCHEIRNQEGKRSERVSLVIGNGSYHPQIGWLENPPLDAEALTAMFRQIGFDVFLVREATAQTISTCLAQLTTHYPDAQIAALHYSGHGVQVADTNYLVPIDAAPGPRFADDLLSFADVIQPLRQISRTTLVFLDACRDNPFSSDGRDGLSALGTTSVSDDIDASQNSYAVIYATAPDMVALDGNRGENSPFTQAILSELPKQGVSIQEALVRITSSVGHDTEWRQVPFQRSALREVLYLNGSQTYDEVINASRLRAAEAQNAFEVGNMDDARRLALSALPLDATMDQIREDFRDALEAVDLLGFASIYDFQFESDGPTSVIVGENAIAALITPSEGPIETAGIYDVQTGELIADVPYESDFGAFDSADFADTRFGLTATNSKTGFVTLLDITDGTHSTIALIPPDIDDGYGTHGVEKLAFSPSGTRLMVHTRGAGLLIFDTATGEKLLTLTEMNFGTETVRISFIRTNFEFKFISEDQFCFVATRRQSVSSPRPDSWDFVALGTYDIGEKEIGKLLWSTDRLSLRSFDCTTDGQYALISGQPLGKDEDNLNTSKSLHGVVEFETGRFLVSETLSDGESFLSRNGDRVAFVGREALKLFDFPSSKFLALPRVSPELNYVWADSLAFRGEIDRDGSIDFKSGNPALFKLDQSVASVIERMRDELTADQRATLLSEQLFILPF